MPDLVLALQLWFVMSLILSALKLIGMVQAPWWVITSPIWGPPIVALLLSGILAAAVLALVVLHFRGTFPCPRPH